MDALNDMAIVLAVTFLLWVAVCAGWWLVTNRHGEWDKGDDEDWL